MMKYTYHTNLDQMKKRARNLIICIDGTWNDPTDVTRAGSDNTNVWKFHLAVERANKNQLSLYHPGVGNQVDYGLLGQLVGGITGWGADQIRDEAYVELVTNYRPGDKIFLFGFSRGAAIARMLGVLIQKEGIPESITIEKDAGQRVRDFKNRGAKQDVDIEMLGVWDTVAAFGIPNKVLGIDFQQINLFKNFTIAGNIKKAFHLVAVDEDREPFRPSLMNDSKRVTEIWFPGVHSDVGGGYSRSGLSDITLDFMIARARERGVSFYEPYLKEKLRPDHADYLHKHQKGVIDLESRKVFVSVKNKMSDRAPKIHHSVFDRMKTLGNQYQPENILELGDNYQLIGPDYSG